MKKYIIAYDLSFGYGHPYAILRFTGNSYKLLSKRFNTTKEARKWISNLENRIKLI